MSKTGAKIFLLAVSASLAAGCQQRGEDANKAGDTAAAGKNASAGSSQQTTIGQTLTQSQDHSTFVQALKSAGLEATMTGTQPYTIFAPTNAAFQKLPNGGEQLMQPSSKGELTGILTYHVVPGAVTAQDLGRAIEKGGGKAQVATVGGANLTATQDGGAIVLADAKGGQARVTKADQLGANGVVHSIDGVLMPQ